MRLLLDTHIWIWAVGSPKRLGTKVRRQIANPANEIFLSPVSVWEANLLARKGRLGVRHSFEDWLDRIAMQVPCQEAPFNLAVAKNACTITLMQGDPGDLFIAATAMTYDLTLATADPQLLALKSITTIDND